ncbi:ribonuclease BN (tRNA processing enzyme) [Sinorhizobium americanum]|uniref:Ribonuclease BN (tRNA processing enzyme) n=1 Tax=Sinorhizobium americanum TaxID=194963 RepID=A0A4R2BAM3_9HYPH|nr:ribonuclease BN (tRNA processing enzyme) [Sinorhizobium americanum]
MSARLVLLGSKGGPAIRPGGPWPTSSLLEIAGRTIVVDCGLGVTRGLTDAGVPLKALDLIVVTHLHSDHVLELGPLIHTAWTAGLAHGVRVFGPAGTRGYWQGFLQSMAFDVDIRIVDEGRPDLRRLVEVVEFSDGQVFSENGLTVSALRVDHPPVTDCFALRFDHAEGTIVFSSDTAYFPPLADFASGADILVHEAMLAAGVDRLVARTGNVRGSRNICWRATHSQNRRARSQRRPGSAGSCCITLFRPMTRRSRKPTGSRRRAKTGRAP